MAKNVTISDVADAAGVSIATVSRAMRGVPSVDPALAKRVLDAAEELGYKPNPTAQNLALGAHHTIGVMVPNLANPHFNDMIKAIAFGAESDGYHMLILDSNEAPEAERPLAETLLLHTDGIILVAPRMPDSDLRALAESHRSIITVNRMPMGIGIHSVATDTFAGMLEICGHLAQLGHRRVAYLAGHPLSWVNTERWRAVSHASSFGLDPVSVEAGYSIEAGYQATDRALEYEPTAILASNDLSAIGVLTRLRELGISVPEQISVTGFDDISFANHTHPPLTTAHTPREELGRLAWSTLHALLNDSGDENVPPTLKADLVVRQSTAAVSRSRH